MADKERVILPPDPNPNPVKFKLPPGSCDTHFHIYGPPHRFPFVDERRYTPPAAPIEHYWMLAERLGLQRGVLVHPAVHGMDNWATLDALRRSEGRLRGMVRASTALSDFDLRQLHEAGVRGVRFALVEDGGAPFDSKAFDTVVNRVAKLGWPVCLHVDGHQIAELADHLRKAPVNIVFDHFGRVDARKGVEGAEFRALVDLMGEKNMWCKISGIDRLMQRGARWEDAAPLSKALVARAGDRVVWGLDWPHSNVFELGRMANDGDLVNALLELVPDETARRKVLVDNPAVLFDFK